MNNTRQKAHTLRARLHTFAGVISFLGVAIVLSIFIVKDMLRDQEKDLVDSLEATKHVWLLKSSMDALQEYLIDNESTISDAESLTRNQSLWSKF